MANRPRDRPLLAAAATASAVVAAIGASKWRQRWAQGGRPNWLGGAIEDIAAVALAVSAIRTSPQWVVKRSSRRPFA
ncbi:MAG: hypothetical protein Q8K63_04465 [Acidimicrobiales bacterium]|nr:hypothetical protein [Acidimicrobiales bacterium]